MPAPPLESEPAMVKTTGVEVRLFLLDADIVAETKGK